MKGWLVVNEFVKSDKFRELFEMLEGAAEQEGIDIECRSNAAVWEKLAVDDYSLEAADRPDFVLFWDKDIKLAYELEREGLRLFNRAQAIADCDDKSLTFLKLKGSGIRQPATFISPKKFHADGLLPEELIKCAGDRLGFPMVMKECLGSFGAQVYLIDTPEILKEKITEMGERPYILQEYIDASKGRDTRIQVIGGRVIAAMLRHNENDFRANITNGGSMERFEPSEEMKEMAIKACSILQLDFAGVDILFGADGPVLCEVNSNAHFKNLYDCTGVNAAEYIIKHIISSMC